MARKTRPDEDARTDVPEERIADLEQRCEDLNARWLRAQADYKNLRRRALADSEAALKREMQPLLEELLLVLDFLDMALASPSESDDARNLAMGVQMTRTKLSQALETAEVEPISTEGVFDPSIHEAVETRRADGAEPGTIVETVRRGYTWHDHVLRPARVIVATGDDEAPAKAGDSNEPTEDEET